jgi:AcrR family transcriptional regulator
MLALVNITVYSGCVTTTRTSASPRREQLLDQAARMFAARGYHGVSVDDLGAACGVSGPALYRHFASKEAILDEMLVRVSRRLVEVGRDRARGLDAAEALAALVAWHLDFALANRALIVVQDRDWDALSEAGKRDVRRLQNSYIALWTEQLSRLRPDLESAEARARVQAAFGLLNSTPRTGRIPDERLRVLLSAMADAALRAA